MRKERCIEIALWDWFKTKSKNVEEVYFNSKNEVNAPVFKVKGVRKIPDLIIKIWDNINKELSYMAIEVKDASISKNIRDGRKIYEKYLINHFENKTKYFIDNKEIKINHFAIATQYSPGGKLFKKENIEFNKKVIGKYFANIILPKFEGIRTKENYRTMLSSYSEYRKKNKLTGKNMPSLGIIISDVLIKFDAEEVRIMSGFKGQPIFQCVLFKKNKKRFQQCLMKL